MPDLVPRLSGSAGVPLQRHLSGIDEERRFGIEQAVERSAMHQIEANQTGEGEQAGNRLLPGLSQPQQQKGDQRDGDLDAHGILADAEKAADFEGLLDPSSEFPRLRRVRSRTRCLNRSSAAGAIRRFGIGPILKLKPRNFRCSG
jgi:hypothetical protein